MTELSILQLEWVRMEWHFNESCFLRSVRECSIGFSLLITALCKNQSVNPAEFISILYIFRSNLINLDCRFLQKRSPEYTANLARISSVTFL
jgi:hypothetical protein